MNDSPPSPIPVTIAERRSGTVTTLPQRRYRRPIVVVLGMHRSGTSLCSHVLSALGVDMADTLAPPGREGPAPENPKGHWERWEIVELHDRIFNLLNRSLWPSGADRQPDLSLSHDLPLPVAWWAEPRVASV